MCALIINVLMSRGSQNGGSTEPYHAIVNYVDKIMLILSFGTKYNGVNNNYHD